MLCQVNSVYFGKGRKAGSELPGQCRFLPFIRGQSGLLVLNFTRKAVGILRPQGRVRAAGSCFQNLTIRLSITIPPLYRTRSR